MPVEQPVPVDQPEDLVVPQEEVNSHSSKLDQTLRRLPP
jgi:hypothetical protein